MKRVLLTVALFCLSTALHASALLTEGFDNVAALSGWTIVNNSTPIGEIDWFQGGPDIFPSHSGAPDSYIATSYLSADFGGEIDSWLITPMVELHNGDTISFYSRRNDSVFDDSLEVLLNPLGTVNVADFTISLLAINPSLDGSYPTAWTQFTIIISGLSGPTNATLGFRYVVPDTNEYGDYLGIDTLLIEGTSVPEPATISLIAAGLGLGFLLRRRRAS